MQKNKLISTNQQYHNALREISTVWDPRFSLMDDAVAYAWEQRDSESGKLTMVNQWLIEITPEVIYVYTDGGKSTICNRYYIPNINPKNEYSFGCSETRPEKFRDLLVLKVNARKQSTTTQTHPIKPECIFPHWPYVVASTTAEEVS